jgi:transcriptional regulator with XRE-family HTH domain
MENNHELQDAVKGNKGIEGSQKEQVTHEEHDEKKEYMLEFGKRLRYLRKLRKKEHGGDSFKIEPIAKHLKVHRSTYNSYELGYRLPSVPTIEVLASYLETSTDYLLFKTDDPDAQPDNTDIKAILEEGPLVYGGKIIPEEHRGYLASVVNSLIENLDTFDLIKRNKSSK